MTETEKLRQNAVQSGGVLGFATHSGRSSAVGEVHSRPSPLVDVPRILVQLSFMTEGGSTVDHAVLADLSRRQGVAPPDRQRGIMR